MKLTKYEHACLDLREGSSRLVIDPGVFSSNFSDYNNVTALVITHVHPDHFDEAKVAKLLDSNPKLQIFTTQEVADKLKSPAVHVPEIYKDYVVGDFTLQFCGGQHATISPSYPDAQNFAVLVNQKLFYPGDSLVQCEKPHTVTAVPAMAPWLKFSEAAEFVEKDTAQMIFPTHNGFINKDGQALYDRLFSATAEGAGKQYQFLAPTTSIEI